MEMEKKESIACFFLPAKKKVCLPAWIRNYLRTRYNMTTAPRAPMMANGVRPARVGVGVVPLPATNVADT
jgi:hypothetical protein